MAIQNRRGVYSDFTPSKMVPGELAVVQSGDPDTTSGQSIYAAFLAGQIKRLATEEDLDNVDTELARKVDKTTGKGLSTNDYTTEEKNKLSGIAAGAEVNVQPDWNQSNTSADDFIKNKPTKTSDFTNDGDGTSNFATESYVQQNGGKIDTISVNGTQQTITNKNVDIAVPIIDNTLTQTGKAADAKVVGDELADVKSDLHYGNLNQKISVNPFVIRTTSDRYGTIRPIRSTVTINQDGTLKITPESSTNTTAGFYTEINNDSSSDRKIYISVSDLTTTRSDFSKWRMSISQNGTTIEDTRLEFTESNYYSIVYDLTGLSADYAIQVNLIEVGTENNSNTTYFTVGSMQYIDLTEIFGAGYEPSISEFEQIYKSDIPYNKHIPTVTSELKEEKLFRLNCINDINDIRKTFMSDLSDKAPAITNTASGSIAHFEDGSEADAVDVVAHIEPVQDLHGYDSPWPNGGGKNLLPYFVPRTHNGITISINEKGVINLNGTATATANFLMDGANATTNSTTDFPNGNYIVSGGINSNIYLAIYDGDTTGTRYSCVGDPINITVTQGFITIFGVIKSGTVVDNVNVYPMIRLATDSDDTYEPYSNICPISGFTGMNITRMGKNLIQLSKQTATNKGIQFTPNEDGSVTINGTNDGTGPSLNSILNNVRLKPGRYKKTPLQNDCYIYIQYRINSTTWVTVPGGNSSSDEFTIEEGMDYDLAIRIGVRSGATVDNFTYYPYIYPVDETDLTFDPPKRNVINVTFPSEAGTVYGGYVDVTKGKLVVDRLFVTVDGNGVHPEIGSSGNGITRGSQSNPNGTPYYITIGKSGDKAVYYPNIDKVSNGTCAICDTYVSTPNNGGNAASLKTNQFRLGNNTVDSNSKLFYFIRPETAVEDLLTSLSTNPFHFVYYLATPTEYDLIPQQINTLLGMNNVWNDCNGDTDVEYKADTKLYIEQLTKPTEDDMTANGNIANGTFFMIGNRLFLSTASIAVGETIVPDTNCTELSLADALNNLNA